MFKLGLVINPYAGIGGALALKGSDGAEVRSKALAMGAVKKAPEKTLQALQVLQPLKQQIVIYTAAGEMGQSIAEQLGFTVETVYRPSLEQTEAIDTANAASCILQHNVDLLMFVGGDGTARNIYDVVGNQTPVIGVPAGCKIHSGCYAITPKSAGRVVKMLIEGEIVSVHEADIRDIDEVLFRQGKVKAKHYGEMQVPTELRYVQSVKMGGIGSDDLVLADIAAYVSELIMDEPQCCFIMGSGTTVASIMDEMGLANTLLGVDIVQNGELVASDLTEQQLLHYLQNQAAKLVVTPIGGQGHLFGRGNQQLSASVIEKVGKENILVVATKSKLQSLHGKPLIVDVNSIQCERDLAGLIPIITGYQDLVLYPIAEPVE